MDAYPDQQSSHFDKSACRVARLRHRVSVKHSVVVLASGAGLKGDRGEPEQVCQPEPPRSAVPAHAFCWLRRPALPRRKQGKAFIAAPSYKLLFRVQSSPLQITKWQLTLTALMLDNAIELASTLAAINSAA